MNEQRKINLLRARMATIGADSSLQISDDWEPNGSGDSKCLENLLSAAGFEPATHALKGGADRVLSRGFINLGRCPTLPVGEKPC